MNYLLPSWGPILQARVHPRYSRLKLFSENLPGFFFMRIWCHHNFSKLSLLYQGLIKGPWGTRVPVDSHDCLFSNVYLIDSWTRNQFSCKIGKITSLSWLVPQQPLEPAKKKHGKIEISWDIISHNAPVSGEAGETNSCNTSDSSWIDPENRWLEDKPFSFLGYPTFRGVCC